VGGGRGGGLLSNSNYLIYISIVLSSPSLTHSLLREARNQKQRIAPVSFHLVSRGFRLPATFFST
jgi:hypothetical protein